MTAETQTSPKKVKARSPAYPVFHLGKAIELARKLWNAQRKQEAHVDSALKTLGYSARSGTALRTIAGLRQYGLIDESGSEKIRLSDLAQDIMHLGENDARRKKALKDAALSPPIYNALWERYGGQLPDDGAIRPFLVRDKGYNEAAVDDLLRDYRATFELAGLDKIAEDVQNEERLDKQKKTAATTSLSGGGGLQPMTLDQELPILVGASNRVARIPFPMTEDDFDLLLGTLNLWKKKLTAPKSEPDAKSQTSNAADED